MQKQDSLIYDMLRTPAQVQEDQLLEIRKRAQAQQAAMMSRLGSDPIINALQQGFADVRGKQAEALARQNQAYAGLGGAIAGALGNEQLGQRIAQAGMTPEARQQAEQRSLIGDSDLRTPEGLEEAATKLEGVRPDVAMRMREKASELRAAQDKAEQDRKMASLELALKTAQTAKERAEVKKLMAEIEDMGKDTGDKGFDKDQLKRDSNRFKATLALSVPLKKEVDKLIDRGFFGKDVDRELAEEAIANAMAEAAQEYPADANEPAALLQRAATTLRPELRKADPVEEESIDTGSNEQDFKDQRKKEKLSKKVKATQIKQSKSIKKNIEKIKKKISFNERILEKRPNNSRATSSLESLTKELEREEKTLKSIESKLKGE